MGLAAALVLAIVASATPWKQVETGDVAVWMRNLPGEHVGEVRARMVMHASVEQVRAVLLDDRRSSKQDHVVEYRTLSHPAPNVWVRYVRLSFPLVDDRDYFIQDTLTSRGGGAFRMSWKPWGLDRPSRFGVVRITQNQGYWDVRPLGPGRALVEFDELCDPGGSVPGWLVDMLDKRVVPDLMRGVERDAQKR